MTLGMTITTPGMPAAANFFCGSTAPTPGLFSAALASAQHPMNVPALLAPGQPVQGTRPDVTAAKTKGQASLTPAPTVTVPAKQPHLATASETTAPHAAVLSVKTPATEKKSATQDSAPDANGDNPAPPTIIVAPPLVTTPQAGADGTTAEQPPVAARTTPKSTTSEARQPIATTAPMFSAGTLTETPVTPGYSSRSAKTVAPADTPTGLSVPTPVQAPIVSPSPVVQTDPTVAAPAITPAYTAQVAKPIFTLAVAPAGEHTVTVRVSPDELGPVTVRAHIGAEGVHIEVTSATATGTSALSAILPDLKRDLAVQGYTATLNLGSDQGANAGGQGPGTHQPRPTNHWTGHRTGDSETAESRGQRTVTTSTSVLDVMA